METEQPRFVIGEKEAAEISAFCEIAKVNKSMLTVGEVLEVVPIDATREELETAWTRNSALNAKYTLDSGWIIERGDAFGRDHLLAERESRATSVANNFEVAKAFGNACTDGRVRVLAVSGSNSYGTARAHDDIDFFSVTRRDSVWIFMLRSLIIARLYSLTGRRAPFCFSYVVDENRARKDFQQARNGLFARDALMARVLWGPRYYLALLLEADWMKGYFPKLYRRRMSLVADAEEVSGRRGRGHAIVNSLLYYTLGNYVRVKAYILNRRLRKFGDAPAIFRAEIAKDRCLYESNRYRFLRQMYPQQAGETTR